MKTLIASICLSIAEMLDPIAHLRRMATDKNFLLTGHADEWIVLTADGKIVAVSDTPVDAIAQLLRF